MAKEITIEDVRKFRISLKHKIENALEDLKWDRLKLAEEYGIFNSKECIPYTPARINQLVNVNRGEEENSQAVYNWLLVQIGEENSKEQK